MSWQDRSRDSSAGQLVLVFAIVTCIGAAVVIGLCRVLADLVPS